MRFFSIVMAALAVACSGGSAKPTGPTEVVERALYVNPFIGGGGNGFAHGSDSPAALAPSGLVKVGPDTSGPFGLTNFLHYSGYWAGDDTVRGFSHLRLQGAGSADYGLVSLMPTVGFDASQVAIDARASKFRKETETASAGYYAVTLDKNAVRAELTATARVAHHRYTFAPATNAGQVVLDLSHVLDEGEVLDALIDLHPGEQRFAGKLRPKGRMTAGFGGC